MVVHIHLVTSSELLLFLLSFNALWMLFFSNWESEGESKEEDAVQNTPMDAGENEEEEATWKQKKKEKKKKKPKI